MRLDSDCGDKHCASPTVRVVARATIANKCGARATATTAIAAAAAAAAVAVLIIEVTQYILELL